MVIVLKVTGNQFHVDILLRCPAAVLPQINPHGNMELELFGFMNDLILQICKSLIDLNLFPSHAVNTDD